MVSNVIRKMKLRALSKDILTDDFGVIVGYVVEFQSKQGVCVETFRSRFEWDKIIIGKSYWLEIRSVKQ